MIGWGTLLAVGWRMLTGSLKGGIGDVAERLVDLAGQHQAARTAIEEAEIEQEIIRLRLIQDIQKPQASRWWSPMQLGQYLIVLPFGLWWAAVFLVSIVKPLLIEGRWTVDDVPPHMWDLAWWVIPAITLGTILERGK
ncbi:hypothetical protein [Shimia sp.]|uniref:hypothetical protein n=1 Tax=Shimia sp. TaxID=1954381 RepID=UPI00329A767D